MNLEEVYSPMNDFQGLHLGNLLTTKVLGVGKWCYHLQLVKE